MSRNEIRQELKLQIFEKIIEVNKAQGTNLTYSDINSVLVDILHEIKDKSPDDSFKKQ